MLIVLPVLGTSYLFNPTSHTKHNHGERHDSSVDLVSLKSIQNTGLERRRRGRERERKNRSIFIFSERVRYVQISSQSESVYMSG